MKLSFTLFLLFTATIAFSQRQTITFYKNNGRQVTLRDSADYMRTISAPDSGSKLYNVNDYYMSGQLKLRAKSRSPEYAYFEGECQEFYKDGKRKAVSTYKTNALVGQQHLFYANGILAETRQYPDTVSKTPLVSRDPIYSIISFNDSTGTPLIANGNGHYKKQATGNDKLEEEGNIKAGLRDGLWKGQEGDIRFEEQYDNGKLVQGTSVSAIGDKVSYTMYRTKLPVFKEGVNKFNRFLANNMRYPRRAVQNDIQGRVYVDFIVEKDGSLTQISSKSNVDPELIAEAIRVVKLSPMWEPGVNYGRPVRVSYVVPIVFTLGR
jgi:TonB family protein